MLTLDSIIISTLASWRDQCVLGHNLYDVHLLGCRAGVLLDSLFRIRVVLEFCRKTQNILTAKISNIRQECLSDRDKSGPTPEHTKLPTPGSKMPSPPTMSS